MTDPVKIALLRLAWPMVYSWQTDKTNISPVLPVGSLTSTSSHDLSCSRGVHWLPTTSFSGKLVMVFEKAPSFCLSSISFSPRASGRTGVSRRLSLVDVSFARSLARRHGRPGSEAHAGRVGLSM